MKSQWTFVYAIINIGACFGSACIAAEQLHNLFACESVFVCFTVWVRFSSMSHCLLSEIKNQELKTIYDLSAKMQRQS